MPNKKLKNPDKLRVDIYVPLDSCACVWDQFMNRMFSVLTPYIRYINQQTKSINSEEARKLKIYKNCVVIENKEVFTKSFSLKRRLEELFQDKIESI